MPKASPNAQIYWGDDGCLRSSQFDDVYSSKVGAIEESLYVFIEQNHLPERWKALSNQTLAEPTFSDQTLPERALSKQTTSHDIKHFTIAETGFGTGLNFLLSAKLWLEIAPATAKLIYISTEKYPLRKDDLIRSHQDWPELCSYCQELQDNYPVTIEGMHTLDLFDGRIQLQLLLGDSTEQFHQQLATPYPDLTQPINQCVDAWFLDGFAPKKNPEMWSADLFESIYRLSKAGTTYATFTAAGIVRKGMAGAGFRNEKRKGFGRKRDMLAGTFVGLPRTNSLPLEPKERNHKHPALWYLDQSLYCQSKPVFSEKTVAIIGGGLAGCINAWQLANDGYKVTIYDRHSQPAQEASGNPQGVLYSKLSHQNSDVSRFSLTSLLFSYRFYQQLFKDHILAEDKDGKLCGTLQLAYNDEQQKLQSLLKETFENCNDFVNFLTPQQASEQAGIDIEHQALFIKKSGWINPVALCNQLIQHENIAFKQADIDQIQFHKTEPNSGFWQLIPNESSNTHGELITQHLIIANSHYAKQFNLIDPLPLQKIKGQITTLTIDPDKGQGLAKLKTAINHEGYLAPVINNTLCFGATFELKADSLAITQEGQDENIAKLGKHIPSIKDELLIENITGGRAAYRCASTDYLPIAGKVPIQKQFEQNYALLSKNRKAHIPIMGDYWPNLYLNIGHGSRGLTSAPLTASLIRAHINNMPTPVDSEMEKSINPARVIIRKLVKKL